MQKVKMILTNAFDPDVRVYKEAKYLYEKGYDVEILCWDRENEYKEDETIILDGIKVKRFFPFSVYGSGIRQLKAFYQFFKECKQYLKDEDYNFLHCHDLDGVIIGFFLRNKKTKLIFDMHEFYEVNGVKKQRIRYIVRGIVNFFQKKSDFIIHVNKAQIDVMKSNNVEKLVFLPNYPEVSNYVNCQKEKSKDLRISYIGAVRQYAELKNLMDACNGMENVKISIHGDGVAYNALNGIKNNYSNIEVTGKYHFSQSAKLYSKTDILYVMYPTSSEQYTTGYPVKLFEAIITRTPVIVSKGTVLEEFVNEYGIGFVVNGNRIDEINKLIRHIKDNMHLLFEKQKNLEKIQYDYNWDNVVLNLAKIYK